MKLFQYLLIRLFHLIFKNLPFYIVRALAFPTGLIYFIFTFRDHNFKRSIDACIAGSQKLDQPMTIEEAKKFCEEKIMSKK